MLRITCLEMEIILHKISRNHFIGLKKSWICICENQTRSVAIDLAHRIHGPSPAPNSVPIFVLHGLLGSKKDWECMCNNITATTNRTVIAVDARNHGDSPHDPMHSYEELASDVSKLMTKFSIEKGFIIGHCMGGRTAMVLALKEPAKVASMVVVDISPVSTTSCLTEFFPKLIDVMAAVDFKGANNLEKATTIARAKINESGIFENNQGINCILSNIGKMSDKSYGWKCNLDALKNNFERISSFPTIESCRYTGPTLFLGGKLSYYIPPDDISGIKRYFPNAYLHYIEGVGHNLHVEDPRTFYETIMQFLSFTTMYESQA